MRDYLIQWDMAPVDAVGRDHVINDFTFEGPDAPTGAQFTALTTALDDFYNAVTGTNALAHYISDEISRAANAVSCRVYKLPIAKGPLGSPVHVDSHTLDTAAVASNLPSEVAAVLSFHGDLTDIPETQANPAPPPAIIRPASRRRGRIYLGPLNDQARSVGAGVSSKLSSTMMADMAAVGHRLIGATIPDWNWSVFSRVAWSSHEVVGGFIDNAFDTQRRRGQAATGRSSFVA